MSTQAAPSSTPAKTVSDHHEIKVWIDGELLPKSEAKISVFDHGLLYGDGVFEGIRAYNGKILEEEEHLLRLYDSARSIRLEIPYSKQELSRVMADCMEANGLAGGDCYIRLVVTRGVGDLGLDPRKCPRAGVICIADNIALYPQEMYDSGLVDAVIVSTVNKTHHRLTMAALDAGLHVLCEKPLAMNVAEADDMADRARSTGRVCMVPFTYRFMPTSQFTKRLVDDGYLGRPTLLNLRYYTGYARDPSYSWRFDREEAGTGVLGDIGSHWIDHARWLFGEIDAVTCLLGAHVERHARPDGADYERLDDTASVLLEFENGAQGVITASAVCHEDSPFGQSHFFDLFGTEGTLYVENDWIDTQRVRGGRSGESIGELPIPDDVWDGVRRSPVHDTYRDVFRTRDVLARGWLSAIRDGGHATPDFDDGAAVQRVVEACRVSAAQRGRVRVADVA